MNDMASTAAANTITANQLTIDQLACVRGERVLFKQLSFALKSQQLLYIQGQNGSGKTTLLRAIASLSSPAAGKISWNENDIKALAEDYHGQLLYIGHLPSIKDDLTTLENVQFNTALSGYAVSKAQAIAALEALGIKRCAHLPARVLSQGQKRRTALAQLWLRNTPDNTPLWILDEPFTALDSEMIATLTAHIQAYVQAGGMVLFTSHQTPDFDADLMQHLQLDAANG